MTGRIYRTANQFGIGEAEGFEVLGVQGVGHISSEGLPVDGVDAADANVFRQVAFVAFAADHSAHRYQFAVHGGFNIEMPALHIRLPGIVGAAE